MSVDWLVLDVSYQWNHTAHDIKCLAALTQDNIFEIYLFEHVPVLHSFLGLNNIQGSFFI